MCKQTGRLCFITVDPKVHLNHHISYSVTRKLSSGVHIRVEVSKQRSAMSRQLLKEFRGLLKGTSRGDAPFIKTLLRVFLKIFRGTQTLQQYLRQQFTLKTRCVSSLKKVNHCWKMYFIKLKDEEIGQSETWGNTDFPNVTLLQYWGDGSIWNAIKTQQKLFIHRSTFLAT